MSTNIEKVARLFPIDLTWADRLYNDKEFRDKAELGLYESFQDLDNVEEAVAMMMCLKHFLDDPVRLQRYFKALTGREPKQ